MKYIKDSLFILLLLSISFATAYVIINYPTADNSEPYRSTIDSTIKNHKAVTDSSSYFTDEFIKATDSFIRVTDTILMLSQQNRESHYSAKVMQINLPKIRRLLKKQSEINKYANSLKNKYDSSLKNK